MVKASSEVDGPRLCSSKCETCRNRRHPPSLQEEKPKAATAGLMEASVQVRLGRGDKTQESILNRPRWAVGLQQRFESDGLSPGETSGRVGDCGQRHVGANGRKRPDTRNQEQSCEGSGIP